MVLQLSTIFHILFKYYFHKACQWMEASWSFSLPSKSRSAVFGTLAQPPWPLTWDWGLWVAENTFLWVITTHKNFPKDLWCNALSHHLQCATTIGRVKFSQISYPFSRNALFDARNISSEVIFLKVKIDEDKLLLPSQIGGHTIYSSYHVLNFLNWL